MKKLLCALLALFILAQLCGCHTAPPAATTSPPSATVTPIPSPAVETSETPLSSQTALPAEPAPLPDEIIALLDEGTDLWDAVMPAIVPKPDAVRFEASIEGVCCYGFDDQGVADYETNLADAGFEPAGYDYMGSYFVKGNLLVQVFTQIYDPEPEKNSITVSACPYLQRDSMPEGAVSCDEALLRINTYLTEAGYVTQSATAALEIDLSGAYEKMGLQAFGIFGQVFAEGAAHTADVFVVIAGAVVPVDDPLETTCVADIDADGQYELFSIFGFGSGIFREILTAYCTDDDGCFMTEYGQGLVPDNGYAELFIEAEGETGVRVWGANRWFGRLYKTVDYGLLEIVNGAGLMPEDADAFPFNHIS